MSIFKKILSATLCIMLVMGCMTGCGENYKDAYIYFELIEKPRTLDPQTASSDSELLIVRNIYEGLMRKSDDGTITGGVGEAANFLVGIAFILPASIIYKRNKSKKTAAIGMTAGGVLMVVLSCFVNTYILIPAYGVALGVDVSAFVKMAAAIHPSIDSLWKMILLCVAPFNAIKVILVSTITTVLYKHISPILKGKA